MNAKLQLTGKVALEETGLAIYYFSLLVFSPFSLDLIHSRESIHHCCLPSHLVFLGLL